MAAKKLPEDAFGYYLSLGSERSYEQVALNFGVTKRTVCRTAQREDWQGRLDALIEEAKTQMEEEAGDVFVTQQRAHLQRMIALQEAVCEIATPKRLQAVFAALFKAAINKEDVAAARLLIDRILGRARSEPLPAHAIDLPQGLENASQVRGAANALLTNLAQGTLSPEDAQKAAAVIEAARKSVETEDLEGRIQRIEEDLQREGKP